MNLEAVGPMLDDDLSVREPNEPEGQALREFSSGVLARLDELRSELESQAITPDAALDELRTMGDELGGPPSSAPPTPAKAGTA